MKNVYINGRFLTQPITGVQRVARELLLAFDELITKERDPIRIQVIVPSSQALIEPPQLTNIEIVPFGSNTGHLWEQFDLPRAVANGTLLCLGNLAPVRQLFRRKSCVVTMVHDLSYRYFPSAYSRIWRTFYNVVVPIVLAQSEYVLTVSESEKKSILEHHPRLIDQNRIAALQNGGGKGALDAVVQGASAEGFEVGSSVLADRRHRTGNGLYVGSMSKRKNAVGTLLTAIELARSPGIDFTFIGATDSVFSSLNIDVPGDVAGKIRFLGQVNDPDVIELEYRKADYLLFPSFYEASPLPPIEAMRLGCPVIAGDIPSLRERCGDAALFVDPFDSNQILQTTRQLIADDSLWSDLQKKGLERASNFSWVTQAQGILEILREVP